MNILQAKRDLQTFSKYDINILANDLDINTSVSYDDLLWLIALKVHGTPGTHKQSASMGGHIPPDMVGEILKNSDSVDTLHGLCQINKQAHAICSNKQFWEEWIKDKDIIEQMKIAAKAGYKFILEQLANVANDKELISLIHDNKLSQEVLNEKLHNFVLKTRKNRMAIIYILVLIQKGADVNTTDDMKYTALMLAAMYSNKWSTEETVKILIDAGADVNAKDIHGKTALIWAAEESNDGSTEATVKLLIDAGADVNMQNNFGNTALMLAVINYNSILQKSSIGAIEMLLDAGTNVNIKNNVGYTVFDMGSNIKPLLKKYKLFDDGAVNIKHNNGSTIVSDRPIVEPAFFEYKY